MRSFAHVTASFALVATVCAAKTNATAPLSSHLILPANFKPPQVFENVNLLRTTNLEKGYIKETINVVIENVDAKPQDEYYISLKAEVISRVGGLEVGDKKAPEKLKFRTDVVEYDPYRWATESLNGFFQNTADSPSSPVQFNFSASHSQNLSKSHLSKRYPLPTMSSPPWFLSQPLFNNKISNTFFIPSRPSHPRHISLESKRPKSNFQTWTFQTSARSPSARVRRLPTDPMMISPQELSWRPVSDTSLPNLSYMLHYWKETLKSVNGAAISPSKSATG